MSSPAASSSEPTLDAHRDRGTGGAAPTRITTSLSPREVVAALDRESRKGKLPGFLPSSSGTEFSISDFGRPFESVLTGQVRSGPSSSSHGASGGGGGGGGGVIEFEIRVKPTLPAVYAIILVATVWPGILLTDSMLKMYFSWYTIPTWWWYLPLTVPFCPWAWWKVWKQSKASGAEEGRELVESIRATLDADAIRSA